MDLHCEVVEVSSGNSAIALLNTESFDIFITDMVMPGLHGFELLGQVNATWPDLALVVMTGHAPEFPYTEVVKAGACDFIRKPFPPLELLAKVVRIIREQEMLRNLKNAECRYRSLFDLASEGMVLLGEQSYQVRDVNRAFERLCGKSREQIDGTYILDFFGEAERTRLETWLSLCARMGGGLIGEVVLDSDSGTRHFIDLSATFIHDAGGPAGQRMVFLTAKDVTERREIERQMADTAQRDELTGLYNKRGFHSRLAWVVKQAVENQTPLSLIMIDLDNFKSCNDTYGHQAGDAVLAATGGIIRTSFRRVQGDTGFRFGGDEFGIILENTNTVGAHSVAQRLSESFDKIERRGTTLSIGVAEYRFGMSVEEFLGAADQALYEAKSQGKNTIAVV
jgi:diguanylate cyclase (GGDEF)-like protein/PAS domain S-box-containing protein